MSTRLRGRPRFVLGVVLVVWMAIPLLQMRIVGQDVVPLVAAGTLARKHPGAVYSRPTKGTHDTNPTFRATACPLVPRGTNCAPLVVPFSPPPLTIPAVVVLSLAGIKPATLLMRLFGAAALVVGFAALARRLAPRHPQLPWVLVVTAVLLTPYAWFTLRFGQPSPLLFLSAALGVAATETSTRTALSRSALLAANIALKAFPLALVAIGVVQRRWRLLAWSLLWLVLLTILTVRLVPTSIFGDFLRSTQAISSRSTTDPYSRGVDGAINLFVDWKTTGAAFYGSIVVRLGVLAALWFSRVRRTEDDMQWAYGWLGVLLLSPVVWLHYQWLVFAAVAMAVATRRRIEIPMLAVLPALAAALSLLGLLNTPDATIMFLTSGLLIAAVIGVPFLAIGPARGTARARGGVPRPQEST